MASIGSFRQIFSRFLPRKTPIRESAPQKWMDLTEEEKFSMADKFIAEGEIFLEKNDDLAALESFEMAAAIFPNRWDIWYRQGCAFFDYGIEQQQEKYLLIASRYFKVATQIDPEHFEIWATWGSVLRHLGIIDLGHHFYLEAREKFQRAIALSETITRPILSELYWDYGLVWAELAQHSGEAIDVRISIQAFQMAFRYSDHPSSTFLHDCGNAYLQLGILVNDSRLYLQAIEILHQSIAKNKNYEQGWASLSHAYSQIYINTTDENYVTLASDCYAHLCAQSPNCDTYWLEWAQILGESGRRNRDQKKLMASLEKCVHCSTLIPNKSQLICQWVETLSSLGIINNRIDLLVEAERKISDATESASDDPDLWHAYGLCMIDFARYYGEPDYYERAIEKLQYGLSLDRTHAEIWHALAIAHADYAELTNSPDLIERSLRFFTRAIDLKPACASLIFDAANAHLNAFELTELSPYLTQAIALYESLLNIEQDTSIDHPDWIFHYARTLEELGEINDDDEQITRALDLYFQVLMLNPETPRIHFHIALCFNHLAGSAPDPEYFRKALQHYRLAIRSNEEDDEVFLQWGVTLLSQAQTLCDETEIQECYAEAEQKILRAGQLGHTDAYYYLACLYSATHRNEKSSCFLQLAQKANALPPIDMLVEEEWLENIRQTEWFASFLSTLESKRQSEREF